MAIPGRIVKVRGQARSFMRPEYGASTHLDTILLEVERERPALRAAMNLRYDGRMSKVLAKLRIGALTKDGKRRYASSSDQPRVAEVEKGTVDDFPKSLDDLLEPPAAASPDAGQTSQAAK